MDPFFYMACFDTHSTINTTMGNSEELSTDLIDHSIDWNRSGMSHMQTQEQIPHKWRAVMKTG